MKALVLRPPIRLWLRQAAALVKPSPVLQRRLLIGFAAAVLLAGAYTFWFRNSSFVSVEEVAISGARGDDADRMRDALTVAARDMTTLNVDHDRLQRAVAGFSSVRTLEVSSDFPHALRITVIEHRPVALAVGASTRMPVAADGSVLKGVPTGGALPTVRLSEPAGSDRIDEEAALRLLNVLGGAPATLTHRMSGVSEKKGKGIVVQIRKGPELIFGDTAMLEAKWLAATRVLADRSSRGADYVDVRLPDRPVAGGVPGGAAPPEEPAPAPPTGQQPAPTAPQPAPTPTPTPQGAQPPAGQQTPQGTPPTTQTPPQTPQQAPAPAPQAPVTQGGGVPANPQP